VRVGSDSVDLHWNAPENRGGWQPVSSYVVLALRTDASPVAPERLSRHPLAGVGARLDSADGRCDTALRECRLDALVPATEYAVWASAANAAGIGFWSEPTIVTTTPLSPPPPPLPPTTRLARPAAPAPPPPPLMRWAEAEARRPPPPPPPPPPAARGAPIRLSPGPHSTKHIGLVSGSVLVALGWMIAYCVRRCCHYYYGRARRKAGHAPLRAAPDDDDDDFATVLDFESDDDSTVTPPKAPKAESADDSIEVLFVAPAGSSAGVTSSCVVFVPRADLAQQRDGEALRRKLLVMGAKATDGALGGPRSVVEYIDANGDRLQLTSRSSVHAVARSASAIRVGEESRPYLAGGSTIISGGDDDEEKTIVEF